MNQNNQILRLLKQAPLTSRGAQKLANCDRMSARILELRKAGHHIRTDMIKLNSGKRVARYTLVKLAKKKSPAGSRWQGFLTSPLDLGGG